MPQLSNDYSKTLIYKLVCNDLEVKDLYVGSTTNFHNRKNKHKSACCNETSKEYNRKVYKFIREHGGWSNWSMIEIEKYPCNDSNEKRARERFWQEELKATLNSIKAITSEEEKTDYNTNYNKQYWEKNRGQIKKYREQNKEKIKQYQKQYQKQYYEKMKNKNLSSNICSPIDQVVASISLSMSEE